MSAPSREAITRGRYGQYRAPSQTPTATSISPLRLNFKYRFDNSVCSSTLYQIPLATKVSFYRVQCTDSHRCRVYLYSASSGILVSVKSSVTSLVEELGNVRDPSGLSIHRSGRRGSERPALGRSDATKANRREDERRQRYPGCGLPRERFNEFCTWLDILSVC
jgi:hypothetical protein